MSEPELNPADLDFLQLALFAGLAANAAVRARIERKGYGDVRDSHGFIVQHLLREPQSVGALAAQIGITQQAVSKSVAELARGGYVRDFPSDDARVRKLQLSQRGKSLVRTTREARKKLEAELEEKLGKAAYQQAKAAVLSALELLDALEPIRQRKVRP